MEAQIISYRGELSKPSENQLTRSADLLYRASTLSVHKDSRD